MYLNSKIRNCTFLPIVLIAAFLLGAIACAKKPLHSYEDYLTNKELRTLTLQRCSRMAVTDARRSEDCSTAASAAHVASNAGQMEVPPIEPFARPRQGRRSPDHDDQD